MHTQTHTRFLAQNQLRRFLKLCENSSYNLYYKGEGEGGPGEGKTQRKQESVQDIYYLCKSGTNLGHICWAFDQIVFGCVESSSTLFSGTVHLKYPKKILELYSLTLKVFEKMQFS